MAEPNITIIKKKKVVAGGGHHGGAWKVAYADFVTAMMAFFLLMWLLNATTEKQRKGIADYFSPTIPLHATSGGGDGPFTGDSVFAELELPQKGRGATNQSPMAEQQAAGETGMATDGTDTSDTDDAKTEHVVSSDEDEEFRMLEGILAANSGESASEDPDLQHIITRVTDEGLVIELFDRPDRPLFEAGTDRPTETLQKLLEVIGRVAATVTNKVALNGHSFEVFDPEMENPNWLLSSNRAQRVRQNLVAAGFPAEQVARVTGMSNSEPIDDGRDDISNNRIEVVLLR